MKMKAGRNYTQSSSSPSASRTTNILSNPGNVQHLAPLQHPRFTSTPSLHIYSLTPPLHPPSISKPSPHFYILAPPLHPQPTPTSTPPISFFTLNPFPRSC